MNAIPHFQRNRPGRLPLGCCAHLRACPYLVAPSPCLTWWERTWPSLALLASWLLALAAFTPTARLACWAVLWLAYLIGTEPAPPVPWTPWDPHLYP